MQALIPKRVCKLAHIPNEYRVLPEPVADRDPNPG